MPTKQHQRHMILKEIDALIHEAMSAKDNKRLDALRLIKSELMKRSQDKEFHNPSKPKDFTEKDEIAVLKKMKSSMTESITMYEKAGRSDLVEVEKPRLAVVESFLPEEISPEIVAEETKKVIAEIEASKGDGYKVSMRDMKDVMSKVKAKYPDADGKTISDIVRSNA